MANNMFWEFLESSTIHGLVHISTAKSRAARVAWVVIVVASFAFAIREITNAFQEWQESPVSTTITTHPITELEFPAVTVCPPRGSNTAVNHLLEKVKDVNFTEEERQQLVNISKEVFLATPNKEYAGQMAAMLSSANMRSIVNGQASMPKIDQDGLVTIRSSELEGSFRTPHFADPEYNGEFHRRPRAFHYALDLPDNMGEIVGEGELVISVETEGVWSFISPENKLLIHNKGLSSSEGEDLCVSKGGHLASVGSRRENDEIFRLASGKTVSLGGRRKAGEWLKGWEGWAWSDGRPWEFTNWEPGDRPIIHGLNMGRDCLWMLQTGTWFSGDCFKVGSYPVCANPPTRRSGNHTLTTNKDSLINPIFHFWWNHTADSIGSGMTGFKLTWHIENGSVLEVGEVCKQRPLRQCVNPS